MSSPSQTPLKLLLATAAVSLASVLLYPYAVPSPAVAAVLAGPPHGELSAATTTGDSRANDYRLERDSCCVGQD